MAFSDLVSDLVGKTSFKEAALDPAFSAKSMMAKGLDKWVKNWPTVPAARDVLRASQLYHLCPREFILNYWNPICTKPMDLGSAMRMSMGTHLHHFLQNFLLGPLGFLQGTWVNTDSGESVYGKHPSPLQAVQSALEYGKPLWLFKEESMWMPDYRISGHVDGVCDLSLLSDLTSDSLKGLKFDSIHSKVPDSTNVALLEIKTVGNWIYKSLNSAADIYAGYKMQACVYQKGFNIPQTLFMFIDRDTFEIKLFVYSFEESLWKTVVDKANLIWTSVRDETLPKDLMKCETPKDKLAKSCPHTDSCWKLSTFKHWIHKCKEAQPDRKFLDLSSWEPSGA